MKHILSIDPGTGGGIAWTSSLGVSCQGMPTTEGDVIEKLREFVALGIRTAIMEDVGKGVMPGRAHAMIVLNVNAAVIRTALACWGVRLIQVRPQEWQKHFGLGKARDCASSVIWKNKLKAEAQRRFPSCDVTLKTADALLLLDYGRLQIKEV